MRALQIVFQNPDSALNRRFSVQRILSRALRSCAATPAREREEHLRELAHSVRFDTRLIHSRPAQLSGGLKQRVAIARAFAGEPRVVVCDEPTSALDVSVQAAILNLLAELQAEKGVTYLFISHDLGVVRYLSDRIAVLYLGRLMELGDGRDGVHARRTIPTRRRCCPRCRRPRASERERIRLEGEIPSHGDPPSGCVFHTRCPRYIGDICHQQEPELKEVEPGHFWRCHYSVEELRELQKPRPSSGRPPTRAARSREQAERDARRTAEHRAPPASAASARRRALKVRAAVLERVGAPLEVTELDLAPPGPGEVLVRLHASGVCHSDLNAIDGTAATRCPAVLGHEGAGVVEQVEEGVAPAPGTRVVLSWMRPAAHARSACAGSGRAGSVIAEWCRGGIPIITAAPRARVDRNAASAASGRPVASKASSTPPPLAARRRRSSSASPVQGTACVAPSASADASFSGATSTATTGSAPVASAPSTRSCPRRRSRTRPRAPGRTPAVRHTAPVPVATAHPASAATSNGTSAGIGMQQAAGTTVRSAKAERNE